VNPSRVYIILHVLGVHKIAVGSLIENDDYVALKVPEIPYSWFEFINHGQSLLVRQVDDTVFVRTSDLLITQPISEWSFSHRRAGAGDRRLSNKRRDAHFVSSKSLLMGVRRFDGLQ
jgi:hypothetical protein